MKILFADDEAEYRAAIAKRLARRGVDVVGAGSGEAALEALAESGGGGFDVVVVDVQMPGMGGLAALSEIKRLYPDMPVVILTAHADMTAAFEGLECGAFCHLLKPVDIDTLHWRLVDAQRERALGRTACTLPLQGDGDQDGE